MVDEVHVAPVDEDPVDAPAEARLEGVAEVGRDGAVATYPQIGVGSQTRGALGSSSSNRPMVIHLQEGSSPAPRHPHDVPGPVVHSGRRRQDEGLPGAAEVEGELREAVDQRQGDEVRPRPPPGRGLCALCVQGDELDLSGRRPWTLFTSGPV